MPSALIADDEKLLANALQQRLAHFWPQLEIVALAADGVTALEQINRLQPDFAFLDIRMPGLSGMQVAQHIEHCRVVFVTAYDEFALAAFEAAACDYLLKPVDDARLLKCIARLQQERPVAAPALPSDAPAAPVLNWITAGLGENKSLIAVDEVIYFKSCDKYVEIVTEAGTHLIRTPLRELAARLDPHRFVQIHRAVIVNLAHVWRIQTDLLGRQHIVLKDSDVQLPLSRGFAGKFKSM
ncbi:LytR/AlgR family response regulator transcription factor [Paludibacterium purpuratum]|uniref:LytTR family two component transcriptional regulator n=1 Tax=Paludibacterium purpuratum TaxID=1144873 RepID=A0A4R7B7E8_9NEIS|nr:LytTR family DNA-binding domain-containing protein [Paludibacterium purpuratum]TDR80628.1 LytTR family two component transcriptional regulator [Paludibacterium purpuratum]